MTVPRPGRPGRGTAFSGGSGRRGSGQFARDQPAAGVRPRACRTRSVGRGRRTPASASRIRPATDRGRPALTATARPKPPQPRGVPGPSTAGGPGTSGCRVRTGGDRGQQLVPGLLGEEAEQPFDEPRRRRRRVKAGLAERRVPVLGQRRLHAVPLGRSESAGNARRVRSCRPSRPAERPCACRCPAGAASLHSVVKAAGGCGPQARRGSRHHPGQEGCGLQTDE